MSGGGYPVGSSGTGAGPTANVYTPTGQPQADASFQGILANLANQGFGPAGQLYPYATNALGNEIGGGNQQYYDLALAGAGGAAQQGQQLGSELYNYGLNALPQAINPWDYQTQQGALKWAALGNNAADLAYGQVPGIMQNAATVAGYAPTLFNQAGPLFQGANQTLQTGFDPQSALFNRTQQRLVEQQNAINAANGVAGSPYASGLTGQALSNFDIDWQNNQLNRQATALGAAGGANVQGAGLYNTGAGLFGQGANLAASGLNLGQGATNLGYGALSLPAQAYQGAYTNLLHNLGGAGQLGTGGINLGATTSQLPYNVANQGTMNTLDALSRATDIGNQQYTLPLSVLNNLKDYLGIGQRASLISGDLGATGLNQQQQGLQGLLSGLGTIASFLPGNRP